MKQVAIIFPTYCPEKSVANILRECLRALKQNTDPELYTVLLIEQGPKYCETIGTWLPMDYIYRKEPLGYAAAVNMGLQIARTQYVCVMNNDVIVRPGWLEQMLADYESIEKCGVLSPQEMGAPTGITYDDHWWSLVLAKREVFDKVGLLDEKCLNARYADQDMNIRIRKAGYQVCRTGNVIIDHANSATYRHLKVDAVEDAERAVMMERYGCCEFQEWAKRCV